MISIIELIVIKKTILFLKSSVMKYYSNFVVQEPKGGLQKMLELHLPLPNNKQKSLD